MRSRDSRKGGLGGGDQGGTVRERERVSRVRRGVGSLASRLWVMGLRWGVGRVGLRVEVVLYPRRRTAGPGGYVVREGEEVGERRAGGRLVTSRLVWRPRWRIQRWRFRKPGMKAGESRRRGRVMRRGVVWTWENALESRVYFPTRDLDNFLVSTMGFRDGGWGQGEDYYGSPLLEEGHLERSMGGEFDKMVSSFRVGERWRRYGLVVWGRWGDSVGKRGTRGRLGGEGGESGKRAEEEILQGMGLVNRVLAFRLSSTAWNRRDLFRGMERWRVGVLGRQRRRGILSERMGGPVNHLGERVMGRGRVGYRGRIHGTLSMPQRRRLDKLG